MNTPERIQELMSKASAGDAGAQNDLGCAYHNGDGVERNYSTARLWYEKAVENGSVLASSNLAIIYDNGFGVDKDIDKAFRYRLKAAELGNTDCMNIIARAYRYGTEPVEKDLNEAFKWYKRSAEKGNVNAAESLAIFYDYGFGCEKDYAKAVKWYRIAADKGLRVAQNNLGSKYQNGQGVERDYHQAFYWYKKAAEQGEEFAECNVGICYLEGKGVKVSKKDAYLWFKKSADHNHERAKQRLQQMVDSGYDPDKDKTILCNNIISKNPFRILGVFINASTRDIQANKTKINAFLSVGNQPNFPSDHLMMEESCPAMYDEDNEPVFVPRDEQGINGALAAINMPIDRVKYALFWFANVSPIDEIALNHITDSIDIEEASQLWEKKDSFSSLLNKGLMNLCVGNIGAATENYCKLIHDDALREEFIKVAAGENFSISEDELSHIFIDALFEYFPNEDWKTAFELKGESYEDDDYISEKLTEGPIKLIETAIAEAMSVDNDSALLSYNASKTLRDTTKSALCELKEFMDTDSVQYQMLVDKLANQILQCAINYFNNSDADDAPFKAMELQKYAQSIAVGKMARDRCTQNVTILQGIIDKLPPAEIRQAVSAIHASLKRYSQLAKEGSVTKTSDEGYGSTPSAILSSRLISLVPQITRVTPMIEGLVQNIVLIREKMGPNSIEYRRIATEVSAVALGITIDNVNNAQKDTSLYGSLISSSNIRPALEDAVKVVQYIELMGPEQKFLEERLSPNKKTLDRMAASFAVFASVDRRTFYTENEYYSSSRSKSELRDFLNKFPSGIFAQTARDKITAIELLENQLTGITTIEACQDVYNKRQRDMACDKLIDDKCFSLVKNKESDCRKYLMTFSNHTTEVKAKLKTIHKWWWALGIVNITLLGCLMFPEMIVLPIVIGIIGLIVDACV